jgi:arylsulfatase B
LFIRWPNGNLLADHTVNHLTAHMDLLPTLIAVCGLDPQKDIAFDGISLEPLLRTDHPKWPEDRIYITQMAQSVPGGYHVTPPKWGNSTVLSQKWRLVHKEELYDIQKDPGQDHNIASQYPDIVKKLQSSYEKYWADIWPFTKKTARISIGHPAQPLTKLSLTGLTPPQGKRAEWSQDGVAKAPEINGKWPIYVESNGKYEFELRRWPREVNRPINAYKNLGSQAPIREFIKDAVQISPVKARIKIGNTDIKRTINPEKVAVNFTVELSQGPTNLHTWFIDAEGTSRTAYWIYVKKIN